MLNPDIQHFKADFFKGLSHPLLIKIFELLADGDKSVNKIQNIVGSEGSAISQQLMILRNKKIVSGVKEGNRFIYSLRDPLIIELLEVAKLIFNNQLVRTISIFDKLQENEANKKSSMEK